MGGARSVTARPPWAYRRYGLLAAVWVAMVGADAAVYRFIQGKGVHETGDEPHYLVVARAISRFSVHPLAAYQADVRTRSLFDWPAGTPLTNLSLQLYPGPRGAVSDHPIGLSVVLAPFVAVGGAGLARLALIAVLAAGVVYFVARTGRLVGLGVAGVATLAVLIAAPALWLAMTQIYPDLLTGVLVAVVGVDAALLERELAIGRGPAVVSTIALVLLPWLHQQNLVAAVLLLGAFVILGWRARHLGGPTSSWFRVLVLAAVSVLSWVLLAVFNLLEYGHLIGLPQPFPHLNGAAVTQTLGLLFDRHQGMFVQVPTVAVGLVGLWMARRWAPVAAIAVVLAAASLLFFNGTFTGAPYGGVSFAGRFQWSSLVPLLAWAALPVAALERARGRWGLWALAAGGAVLWMLQAVPILSGTHQYYNQMAAGLPWDPASYPGWWGPVDRDLPVLAPSQALFGRPSYGLVVAVAVVILGGAIVAVATRPGLARAWPMAALGFPAVAVLAAVSLAAPQPLPTGPLTYSGSALGSPLVAGTAPLTESLPLQGVAKGAYVLRLTYTLAATAGPGSAGAVLESYCKATRTGRGTPPASRALTEGSGSARVTAHCAGGSILYFQVLVQPASRLTMAGATLSKTSAS